MRIGNKQTKNGITQNTTVEVIIWSLVNYYYYMFDHGLFNKLHKSS